MTLLDDMRDDPRGTGYQSVLYGVELTPDPELGRLVLVFDGLRIQGEDRPDLCQVRVGVVAPDRFEGYESFTEMFGEPVEEGLLGRAKACALYQAIVPLDEQPVDDLDIGLRAYIERTSEDALFLDAMVGDLKNDPAALIMLRTGEDPADTA